MKTVLMLVLTVVTLQASVIMGTEDLFGPKPGSDRDFNDMEYSVTGIHFDLTNKAVNLGPSFGGEYPFPGTAWYFDNAEVTGTIGIEFLRQQAAYTSELFIRVGSGEWLLVGDSITVDATVGQAVGFKMFVENTGMTFYSDKGMNGDGLDHLVVNSEGDIPNIPKVPEPGVIWLIGGGLVLVRFGIPIAKRK
jgi:hypothetical protein